MTEAERNAKADRTELAYCRSVYRAAKAAWLARGSDRNIDRLYAAEERLLAVEAAIKRSREV